METIRARLDAGVEIELWFQDEARIGQKNKLTRRWARRGTRPCAPHDQRTQWAYIFGAICPAKGKAIGLVLPWCNTDAMNAHLAEISAAVDPGAHAVLILDQAGWHTTSKLRLPGNITILPLPPKAPELNPLRTSGNSCATIGSQIESLSPTITSSTYAATPATACAISLGASCPSVCATGRMHENQRRLVLLARFPIPDLSRYERAGISRPCSHGVTAGLENPFERLSYRIRKMEKCLSSAAFRGLSGLSGLRHR
jgi:hypothetical protein